MNLAKIITLACLTAAVTDVSAQPSAVPLELFSTMNDLEVTVWAQTPMFYNPTNMDVDKDGRIWVAEGVNYRGHYDRKREGDRIVVMEDTDGNGSADKSWVFVQEAFLRAPLGVAVLDNKIIVSMTPDLVIFTDVDRDMKFNPAIDKREVLLTGFNGRIHDHSLHSVTFGPDGQYYWNAGNAGSMFTDKSGRTFRIGSGYGPSGDHEWRPQEIAGAKSDDGHVYLGGFAARMNPDGTQVEIIGHNFRNSYEQTVTSFGDVFQNDNDDPPAARTAFLMEYGNAGFSSFDGRRSWGADRRPGQSTPIAEWRQEDPGTMPAGDVYGGGAPTGIAFYETGALGKRYEGMLVSCEPARNTIFGYFPEAAGAGFKLDRFDFVTTNSEGDYAGADFKGGRISKEVKTLFRPSDVVVGPDGAIYLSDWYDSRVGGHQDNDETLSGTVYRIAPKGFKPVVPKFDLSTTAGQLTALQNPAVNVRHLGFNALKAQGAKAIGPVSTLLSNESSYIQARAVWLLSQLGDDGIAKVRSLLEHDDERIRTVAYRALRRQNSDFIATSKKMARDNSPAVRREVALAMRDVPASDSVEILATVASRFDGIDRWYLEAVGTGASGKESAVYDKIASASGNSNGLEWSPTFAALAWRLHPAQAIAAFHDRALADSLSTEDRKAAMVALAYSDGRAASDAMLDIAEKSTGAIRGDAMWWLLNKKGDAWREYGIDEEMKTRGIFDPAKVQISGITTPEAAPITLEVDAILALKGDVARGKAISTACYMCHRIDGNGADVGPELTTWAQTQTSDVVIRSIINPSADIAHGFEAQEIVTVDNLVIHGIVLANGDPVIVSSMGGLVQMIPKNRIKAKHGLNRSLMFTAEQLGLGGQEVADLLAFLKSL